MRKGQAAMEFLMTYGWAILVVIVAIGALAYFGVLSPSKMLPEKCTFPAGYDCAGKASISFAGKNASFVLTNNQGANVEIQNNVTALGGTSGCGGALAISACTPAPCTPAAIATGLNITNNDKVAIAITCPSMPAANSKFKDTFRFKVKNLDTGLILTVSGDVIGTVGP